MINKHDADHEGNEQTGMSKKGTANEAEEPVRKNEMAEWLKVSPRTLNAYMRQKRIPFLKGPKYVLFKKGEVEAALLRKEEAKQEKPRGDNSSSEKQKPG